MARKSQSVSGAYSVMPLAEYKLDPESALSSVKELMIYYTLHTMIREWEGLPPGFQGGTPTLTPQNPCPHKGSRGLPLIPQGSARGLQRVHGLKKPRGTALITHRTAEVNLILCNVNSIPPLRNILFVLHFHISQTL